MKARKFFVGVRSDQSERYFNRRYNSDAQYNPTTIDNQFVRLPFALLDNSEFRKGLMAKARFRTYLLLRRYVVRAQQPHDTCLVFDRYWSHGELATSIKLERLAEKLNLPKSTVSDHIWQLEKDGVIEVNTIEPSEATDNVKHLVFVLGTCFNGQERWYIDEVFSGEKGKNSRPRRKHE
jgi:hypothetical protein